MEEIFKIYGCKDVELIFSCRFVAFSIQRDKLLFKVYSPKFDEIYLGSFTASIDEATEVVMPRSLELDRKAMTARLYRTLDGLDEPLRDLTGYIKLAKATLPITLADFGFASLHYAIDSRDAEGAFKGLQTLNANIAKFHVELTAQGLSPQLIAGLIASEASIADEQQKQYEIEVTRKSLLKSNIGLLNALYTQLGEILVVGKVLFTGKDSVKLKEYTFSELLKKVHRQSSPAESPDAVPGM